MKKSLLAPILCLSSLYLASFNLLATENKTNNVEPQHKRNSPKVEYHCSKISRAEAISQAKIRARGKGKVVGVQLNGSVYRVRMLLEKKRIKTISINACR